jgi:hypothetical protein
MGCSLVPRTLLMSDRLIMKTLSYYAIRDNGDNLLVTSSLRRVILVSTTIGTASWSANYYTYAVNQNWDSSPTQPSKSSGQSRGAGRGSFSLQPSKPVRKSGVGRGKPMLVDAVRTILIPLSWDSLLVVR